MKKEDLLNLYNVLNSERIRNIKGYTKFQYAVIKNLKLINVEVESLNEILKEYNSEVAQCYKEFSIKDKDGNPAIINGRFKVNPEFKEEFKNKISSIRELHKEQIDSYNSILGEESEIQLRKVKLEDIEGIELDTGELYIIDLIIEE